ncbi:MAG: hypothetical protein RLP15_14080 [Cryomorphaceae bacterium]
MLFKALIVLGGLAGLWMTPKNAPPSVKAILGVLLSGLAVSLIPLKAIQPFGFDLFAIGLLLIVGYSAFKSALPLKDRLLLAGSGSLCFLSFSFHIYHLPGAGWLSLTMVLPIALFLYATLKRRQQLVNELGLLMLCATEGLIELLVLLSSLMAG